MTTLLSYLAAFLDIIATPEDMADAMDISVNEYYFIRYILPILVISIIVISVTLMIVIMVRHNKKTDNDDKEDDA